MIAFYYHAFDEGTKMMPEFSIGDEVVVYTSEDEGLRRGVVAAVSPEDANLPMLTVKIGEGFWIGAELHLFSPDTSEEAAQASVNEKLATYGQELAERRARREAELEAAMAAEEEEAEEEEGTESS